MCPYASVHVCGFSIILPILVRLSNSLPRMPEEWDAARPV